MSGPKTKKAKSCQKCSSDYVAFDPDNGCRDIIARGSNVGKVIDSARDKGIDTPAIMFVPKEGVTYIY